MPVTILITRPEESAKAFERALRGVLGNEANIVVSPVLRIEMTHDPVPLGQAKTLIFTSSHAVRAFAQLSEARDFTCYTVGDSTSATARDAGFQVTEGGGTAEQLFERLVSDMPATPCLYLRGNHVAQDLSGMLNSAGLVNEEHVIYSQVQCPLSPQARCCMDAGSRTVVPLFSPRSARLFFEMAPETGPLWIAAMSDNVASVVPEGRAGRLEVALSPTFDAMLRLTADLFVAANQLEGDGPSQ